MNKTEETAMFKNAFYIIYISISAFFLMNDYKLTALIMMVVLAPAILLMEHYESNKTKSQDSEAH